MVTRLVCLLHGEVEIAGRSVYYTFIDDQVRWNSAGRQTDRICCGPEMKNASSTSNPGRRVTCTQTAV
jgi:hypothetical protein